MVTLLKPGGTLYLSTPIGRERVEFNANWVFDPRTILRLAESNYLALDRLTVFSPAKGVHEIILDEVALENLASCSYQLGIFVLIKLPPTSV